MQLAEGSDGSLVKDESIAEVDSGKGDEIEVEEVEPGEDEQGVVPEYHCL